MKRVILACILAAELSAANAQLYSFPAPPMTVADCRPGHHWYREPNRLPFCKVDDPPAPPPDPTPPPPPPPPSCRYDPNRYFISIGDMGQCSAEGGCEGKGYAIVWDGGSVGSQMWTGYMDWTDLGPLATVGINASSYRIGAVKASYLSNGNNMGIQVFEICPK